MNNSLDINREISRNSSVSYRWVILGVITMTHVTSVYSGQSIQPLAPFLQSELHLNHAQIGMFTSIFFMGALFLSIPMGWLVDRIGVYWTMGIGQLIVGSFILSVSLANSFLVICGLIFLAGMGYACINPATGKAVMLWFSIKGRATAMGVKQTGIPIGGALAAATMPGLAIVFGWRKGLVIAGIVSLLSVLPCLLFYRESRGEESNSNHRSLRPSSLMEIFKNRDLMILSGIVIIFMGLQTSIQTYLVLFCKERLIYSVVRAGYFLSLFYLGAALGRLTWGAVSDFFFRGRRSVVLMMIGGLSSVICLSFVFLTSQFPAWSIAFLIFVFGFSSYGWNGTYLTLVAELAGRDRVGIATGVSLSIGFLGILVCPPFFGYIVDQTQSYSYAWFIFSIMMGLATLSMRWIQEPVRGFSE